MDSELIRKAKSFAEETFRSKVFENHVYHNLRHTRDVVAAAEEIGSRSELSEEELESAIIAAWLHDIGYMDGDENHEESAAGKARELLSEWGAPYKKIMEVTEAILATKVPQQPKSMVSKVVCDADLYHFAKDDCTEKSNKLREEWKLVKDKNLTDTE